MYCETAKATSLAKEIEKETKVCLPLVHLEAAVFFALVVAMGQDFEVRAVTRRDGSIAAG